MQCGPSLSLRVLTALGNLPQAGATTRWGRRQGEGGSVRFIYFAAVRYAWVTSVKAAGRLGQLVGKIGYKETAPDVVAPVKAFSKTQADPSSDLRVERVLYRFGMVGARP